MQNLLFPVIVFAAFYFFLMRPQQQRAKAQRRLIENLKVGDEVVTIGGVLGTVAALHELNVELEVAEGIRVRVVRPAISGLVPSDDEPDALEGTDGETPL